MSKEVYVDAEKWRDKIRQAKIQLEIVEREAEKAVPFAVDGKIPIKCWSNFAMIFQRSKNIDQNVEDSWPGILEAFRKSQQENS